MNDNIYTLESSFSLEVFPPKKDDEFEHVYQVLDSMAQVKPDFISVTYGAGGSNSKKTVEIASYIQNTLHIPAIAHLTCVGSKKEDISRILEELKAANVHHILALRGDRPRTMTDEQFYGREFTHASDMMAFIKANSDIHMAGACYPEKHYEAASLDADLNVLKIKQEMGAEFFISQLFFDNSFYYNFAEKATAKGITAPLCAGIMPITSSRQIETSISLSGSSVPKKLTDLIAKYGENPEDMRKAGTHFVIEQILDLKNNGVKHIHLYSMNKPKTTAEIVKAL
ncbi:MAG: methylenetetrahydrofolate reductase [Lachnospiraceae bacterium]|nr:methylenetetrahydrofolate reductase [NAD(P)H] [Lachnospiraceae bacterium]